jgi:hypothetical protein
MIVKKPWIRVKCEMWNNTTKEFELVFTKYYIGYFLLGFIPLYLIKIRETIKFNKEEIDTYVSTYGKLLIK